jgi:hypothetical protein
MISEDRLDDLMTSHPNWRVVLRAVEREAYEVAAKVCDSYFPKGSYGEGKATHCAAAIRKLTI